MFDGECELCTGSVNFVKKVDRRKKFVFVPFPSDKSTDELNSEKEVSCSYDSIILKSEKGELKKSSAVLRIFKDLGFPWNIFYIFIIIPGCFRDKIYDFIAIRRNMFSGRKRKSIQGR